MFAPITESTPAWLAALLLGMLAALGGALLARERHRRAEREANRILNALSESVTATASAPEIAQNLADQLPSASEASSVRLYLHNPTTKSLELVPTREDPDPMAIVVEAPPEGLAQALVKCFTTRATVHIPDVRRHPLVSAGWQPGVARSAMFVPLLAQHDRLGVLEVARLTRIGYFSKEDQAAVQHLSNQVASSLKLQEQRSVREQLQRSEKLAATAQLISAVAAELSEPLEQIQYLAGTLLSMIASNGNARREDSAQLDAALLAETRLIASESRRASEILARLVSFARPGGALAQAVDVSALVAGLVQFREPGWKARGLRVQNRLAPDPAFAVAARGQLEQLFLNLLVHAEQCASHAPARTLSLASSRLGGRIIVEIHYTSDAPRESLLEAGDALGLDVCRGIAAAHGGEIRVVSRSSWAGFEVDLPLMPESQMATPAAHPEAGQERAPQGAIQGNPQGAIQANPQGAVQGNPQGAVQGNPQGAVQGNPQGAVEGDSLAATRENKSGAVRQRAIQNPAPPEPTHGVFPEAETSAAIPSAAQHNPAQPSAAQPSLTQPGTPKNPPRALRPLTLLLVDSDLAARRQLFGMLAVRGHRVIPVPAEQAADLAPRMRFDAIFWAVRSSGPKWSDQQERIRPTVPSFVLLSDGFDRDLARSLEDSGGFLLARPLLAADLDRLLEAIDARAAARAPA